MAALLTLARPAAASVAAESTETAINGLARAPSKSALGFEWESEKSESSRQCRSEAWACAGDPRCGSCLARLGRQVWIRVTPESDSDGRYYDEGGASLGWGGRGETDCRGAGARVCRLLADPSGSIEACAGNAEVAGVFGCLMGSVGCEPEDAPCLGTAREGRGFSARGGSAMHSEERTASFVAEVPRAVAAVDTAMAVEAAVAVEARTASGRASASVERTRLTTTAVETLRSATPVAAAEFLVATPDIALAESPPPKSAGVSASAAAAVPGRLARSPRPPDVLLALSSPAVDDEPETINHARSTLGGETPAGTRTINTQLEGIVGGTQQARFVGRTTALSVPSVVFARAGTTSASPLRLSPPQDSADAISAPPHVQTSKKFPRALAGVVAPGAAPSPTTPAAPGLLATASPVLTPSLAPLATTAPSDTAVAPSGSTSASAATGFFELGAGFVTGFFSATGMSVEFIESRGGEEDAIQQVICALDACPGGLESVLVGVDSGSVRARGRARELLLALAEEEEELEELEEEEVEHGGEEEEMEIDYVSFVMPAAGEDSGGDIGGEGEGLGVLTGAQQAAALFNNIANTATLAAAAQELGVGLEDLDFGNLRYFQGVEVPLAKEFDAGSVDLHFARDTRA
eukprot:jgi/Undpi1/2340/HiC_scaffold_13.g05723.m1